MTFWRQVHRRLADPIAVEHTVPPADVAGPVMVVSAEATDLEQGARLRHAAHRVERELWAQSTRCAELRNAELVDFLLDLRATLRPSAPGSEVLREVPVTVGRAS